MSEMYHDEWLREQIAFAIFNNTNPPHVREHITLQNIAGNPELKTALGDGWTATSNLGMDWRLNRGSFLKLADAALRAMEAADADGSAYVHDDLVKALKPFAEAADSYADATDEDEHIDNDATVRIRDLREARVIFSKASASNTGGDNG